MSKINLSVAEKLSALSFLAQLVQSFASLSGSSKQAHTVQIAATVDAASKIAASLVTDHQDPVDAQPGKPASTV